jgi:uncharacterized protein YdeI (YjbR/CyaY-like superfamily)
MPARFFRDAAELRDWFEKNHGRERELWVGYFKKGIDRPGVSYLESVDAALCFGWIDGMVRRIDDRRYMQRFSPRTPKSPWSHVNVEKAERLIAEGKMHPAGKAAFDRRSAERTGVYSYENRPRDLDPSSLRKFHADAPAWAFYEQQPAGYRRTVAHWVLSAKREETRARRLAIVMEASRKRKRIDLLSPGRGA